MQNWVTIMTFYYPHESYAIKGALESAGIDVFMKDELTIQVDNFLSNAMGGIKLQVPEEQVNEAIELLKANGYFSDQGKSPKTNNKIEVLEGDARFLEKCPFCESTNLGKTKKPTIFTVLSMLILRFIIPVFKKNHYCYDCRKEWRYK